MLFHKKRANKKKQDRKNLRKYDLLRKKNSGIITGYKKTERDNYGYILCICTCICMCIMYMYM